MSREISVTMTEDEARTVSSLVMAGVAAVGDRLTRDARNTGWTFYERVGRQLAAIGNASESCSACDGHGTADEGGWCAWCGGTGKESP